MNSNTPLTFAVEIQFALACTGFRNNTPVTNPPETRTVPTWDVSDEGKFIENCEIHGHDIIEKKYQYLRDKAKTHIVQTLRDHGLSAIIAAEETYEIVKWVVADETTFEWLDKSHAEVEVMYNADEDQRKSDYKWVRLQIKSPTCALTPHSLGEVERVCEMLKRNYVVSTEHPAETGLHVNIGSGDQGFELEHMKKLVAFLWAFEPVFDTLHYEERNDSIFTYSMREMSRFATRFLELKGEGCGAVEGARSFLGVVSMPELAKQAGCLQQWVDRYRYDFSGLVSSSRSTKSGRQERSTVEFRQHESTLDGEKVSTWVKTLARIIDWVRGQEQEQLMNIIESTVPNTTKWLHDRKTRLNGTIISDYAVLFLLGGLGLQEEMNNYEKWMKSNRDRAEKHEETDWQKRFGCDC